MQRFLKDVDRFEADVYHGRRGIDFSVAQTADQIFNPVCDSTQASQSDLCRRTFNGVDGAEEFVNFFRVVVALERNQAIADDLQMFFGFGLKEFQNLSRNLVICGQQIKIGTSGSRRQFFCRA